MAAGFQQQAAFQMPATFTGGLTVGSGRTLVATPAPLFPAAPTFQAGPVPAAQPTAQNFAAPVYAQAQAQGGAFGSRAFGTSSMLSAIGNFIPADMAAKLAKAPYVYYTYFYTIVYYKVARPETLVQGVAIKDIMYYISEYLIKMQTQQVTKNQVQIFQNSIGMEFDVSRSFDIVNDILNELRIGEGQAGLGPAQISSSAAYSIATTAVPAPAPAAQPMPIFTPPAATSAPVASMPFPTDLTASAKPSFTTGSGLSR